METINIKTKLWKKEKQMPTHEEIRSVLGRNVPITTDSEGNITFGNESSPVVLTPEEKQRISLFLQTK